MSANEENHGVSSRRECVDRKLIGIQGTGKDALEHTIKHEKQQWKGRFEKVYETAEV